MNADTRKKNMYLTKYFSGKRFTIKARTKHHEHFYEHTVTVTSVSLKRGGKTLEVHLKDPEDRSFYTATDERLQQGYKWEELSVNSTIYFTYPITYMLLQLFKPAQYLNVKHMIFVMDSPGYEGERFTFFERPEIRTVSFGDPKWTSSYEASHHAYPDNVFKWGNDPYR